MQPSRWSYGPLLDAYGAPPPGTRMDWPMQCWSCQAVFIAMDVDCSRLHHLVCFEKNIREEAQAERQGAVHGLPLFSETHTCCPMCGHPRGPNGWKPCIIHDPWTHATAAGGYDVTSLAAQVLIHGPERFRAWLSICWVVGAAHGGELGDALGGDAAGAAAYHLAGAVASGWIEPLAYLPRLEDWHPAPERPECYFYRANKRCVSARDFLFGPPEWP